MHCRDGLRESFTTACFLSAKSLIFILLCCITDKQELLLRWGGQNKGANDFFVFSVEDSSCSGVNCISGDEISEQSLQWSSPALSAWFPPGRPPNGCITRSRAVSSNVLDHTCWLALRISPLDGLATRESSRLFCVSTARKQLVVFPRNTRTERKSCDSFKFCRFVADALSQSDLM